MGFIVRIKVAFRLAPIQITHTSLKLKKTAPPILNQITGNLIYKVESKHRPPPLSLIHILIFIGTFYSFFFFFFDSFQTMQVASSFSSAQTFVFLCLASFLCYCYNGMGTVFLFMPLLNKMVSLKKF